MCQYLLDGLPSRHGLFCFKAEALGKYCNHLSALPASPKSKFATRGGVGKLSSNGAGQSAMTSSHLSYLVTEFLEPQRALLGRQSLSPNLLHAEQGTAELPAQQRLSSTGTP